MKTLITIFKPILFVFILIALGGHAMAKDFYEVKNPQKILDELHQLMTLSEVIEGEYFIQKAPLMSILSAEQFKNSILLTINIRNDNDFEWFLKKEKDSFIIVFDQGGSSVGRYPRGVSNPSGLMVSMPPPVDADYWLLEPRETMDIKIEIPAQEFYELWDKKDVYLQYSVNSDLPPILINNQKQIDPNKYYTSFVQSNRVRIRCDGYDHEKGIYICDIDVLAYGQ